MQDILKEIQKWQENKQSTALATVVRTWGASPRGVGASMGVNENGLMTGSVSGGCVENAVIEQSMDCIKTGKPRFLHYGIADDLAWEVGLSCGGTVDVIVRPANWSLVNALQAALAKGDSLLQVIVIKGSQEILGRERLFFLNGIQQGDDLTALEPSLTTLIRQHQHNQKPIEIQLNDETTLLLIPLFFPPRLVVVGAVHTSIELVRIANVVGYHTIVVDPRRAFLTPERFPEADELILKWPDKALDELNLDPGTAVVFLTHDPKIDDPGLQVALRSPAGYVGALGGRNTQQTRRERLQEAGFTPEQISRLYGPVGLKLGGREPGEIAVSIMAQIIQIRNAAA